MNSFEKMDITRDFIRSKRPCSNGYRWYLKRQEAVSGYQRLLDDLVLEGRVADACWLLDQLGPTDDVLTVDEWSAEALVFAGTVVCRRSLDVDTVLRTGGALTVMGGIRAGTLLQVGGELRTGGAVQCGGAMKVGSDARIGWSLNVAEGLTVGGGLRVGWDLFAAGQAHVEGQVNVGQGLVAEADFVCHAGMRTGADLTVAGSLDVSQGVWAAGSIRGGRHLQCGWGMLAGDDIVAEGAIRAGETLQAGGVIESGPDYGVFAGLVTPMDAWERCAFVRASAKPARLISGCWSGA